MLNVYLGRRFASVVFVGKYERRGLSGTRHSRMSTRQPAISGILWPGSLMPRLDIENTE
jgi:hypothetical protein